MWHASLQLFVVVTGGCSKCSDAFYNLLLDVGSSWTVQDVYNSEEVWWLRKTCQRMRCQVAKQVSTSCLSSMRTPLTTMCQQVADAFGISIKTHKDIHSYENNNIGVPTIDTVEFDMTQQKDTISIQNACTDAASIQNGVLCKMHASEGYWLFKGATRSSTRSANYGHIFSTQNSYNVFPTRAPLYKKGMGSPQSLNIKDHRLIVRKGQPLEGNIVSQCFDEAFMRNLEQMGWNRDHGVVELVPLIVGC